MATTKNVTKKKPQNRRNLETWRDLEETTVQDATKDSETDKVKRLKKKKTG